MPRRVITQPPPPPKKARKPRSVYSNADPDKRPQRTPCFEKDPHLIDKLVAGIERGLHPHEAAVLAGISWRSFERYRQYGRLGDPRYLPVEQAIREAEAKFANKCIAQIMRAGMDGVGSKDPDWKAVSKVLELRLKDWKPKVEVTSQAEQESEARRLLEHVRKVCGDEAAEAVIQSYLSDGGEGVSRTTQVPETGSGETT